MRASVSSRTFFLKMSQSQTEASGSSGFGSVRAFIGNHRSEQWFLYRNSEEARYCTIFRHHCINSEEFSSGQRSAAESADNVVTQRTACSTLSGEKATVTAFNRIAEGMTDARSHSPGVLSSTFNRYGPLTVNGRIEGAYRTASSVLR
jgi:hypothetical protein